MKITVQKCYDFCASLFVCLDCTKIILIHNKVAGMAMYVNFLIGCQATLQLSNFWPAPLFNCIHLAGFFFFGWWPFPSFLFDPRGELWIGGGWYSRLNLLSSYFILLNFYIIYSCSFSSSIFFNLSLFSSNSCFVLSYNWSKSSSFIMLYSDCTKSMSYIRFVGSFSNIALSMSFPI